MNILTHFNQQVSRCQDDAYTLAWYLLGDEVETEAVTQKAIEAAFHCFSERQVNCRLLILRQVVSLCRGRTPIDCGFHELEKLHNLNFIAEPERIVLVLIDILGLSYTNASHITGASIKETGRLLTRARLRMVKTSFTIERDGR